MRKNPCFGIDITTVEVTDRFAKLKNIDQDVALLRFFESKTYETLIDVETGLCFEMTDYVYEMFLEEVGEQDEL